MARDVLPDHRCGDRSPGFRETRRLSPPSCAGESVDAPTILTGNHRCSRCRPGRGWAPYHPPSVRQAAHSNSTAEDVPLGVTPLVQPDRRRGHRPGRIGRGSISTDESNQRHRHGSTSPTGPVRASIVRATGEASGSPLAPYPSEGYASAV